MKFIHNGQPVIMQAFLSQFNCYTIFHFWLFSDMLSRSWKHIKHSPCPTLHTKFGPIFWGQAGGTSAKHIAKQATRGAQAPGFTMDALYHENVTNFAACNEKLHSPITTKVHVLIRHVSEFITKHRKPLGAFLWVRCGEVPLKIWFISITRSRIVIIWIIWITFFWCNITFHSIYHLKTVFNFLYCFSIYVQRLL